MSSRQHKSHLGSRRGSFGVGTDCVAEVDNYFGRKTHILAKITAINGENVHVKDENLEPGETVTEWTVSRSKVHSFPDSGRIEKGEQVLARWYLTGSREWSTEFYPATVVEVKDTNVAELAFIGDPACVPVPRDKILKRSL
ncbi:hypothetical protein RCL1_006787 [Eukaryota sp. TZLM3-RCL]